MPGSTKKLMQKRRFVQRLQDEQQEKPSDKSQLQFDPNNEEFFKDDVDLFHEKRQKNLDRSGLLEPAESSSDEDEEEEVLGLGLADSDDDLEMQEDDDEELEGSEGEGYAEEKNRMLLQRYRKYLHSDDEEVNGDEENGGVTSDKAWGQTRSAYYNTDYVPDELGGKEEEEMAEQEEKEALALQRRLAEQLVEEDYLAPEFSLKGDEQAFKKRKSKDFLEEDVVVPDLTVLSREEKMQILAKESPEAFQLLEDYKTKLQGVKKLYPLVQYMKREPSNSLYTEEDRKGAELLLELYQVYVMNIAFYLTLKLERVPVRNHPVISQLSTLREHLLAMKDAETCLFSRLDAAMAIVNRKNKEEEKRRKIGKEEELEQMQLKKKGVQRGKSGSVCGVAGNLDQKRSRVKDKSEGQSVSRKRLAIDDDDDRDRVLDIKEILKGFDPETYYQEAKDAVEQRKRSKMAKYRATSHDDDSAVDKDEDDPDARRAITYQMSRNKGLAPKRKKEQRNPRVKHKLKYAKAQKRRNGQVLSVVKSKGFYGGEQSGIRTTVSRSTKIK